MGQKQRNLDMTKSRCDFGIYKCIPWTFCIAVIFLSSEVSSFNVDTKNVKIFSGPPGVYFGYAMGLLRNVQGNWLLVSAPKSYDPLQPGVRNPGLLLRCPLDGDTTRCDEVVVDTSGNVRVGGTFYGSNKVFEHDKTNQWLGVALDVSPSNDRIAVCAHRWKDSKYVAGNDLLYMHGLCYEVDANFRFPARLLPLMVDYDNLVHRIERYPIWAYATLGQSVKYTKNGNGIVMGAPGINDWQGGFVIEDSLRNNYTVQPLAVPRQNWLIGYTIETARLIRTDVPYIIAGAPRANLNGTVYVFEYKSDQILNEPLVGDQFGSYFGSVLCAADVNGDQLDDVIVGAPLFSANHTEEGRVYVYINKGLNVLNVVCRRFVADVNELTILMYCMIEELRLERQPDVLNGTLSELARFGSAIANIGDINKDSFNDIAVGAPYENNGEGVVYIYNGYADGLWSLFTQRITGGSVDPGIRSFGASITSRSNTLSDVFAVGVYESDRAFILRVNPVVSIETTMHVTPLRITASGPYLDLGICFRYTGASPTLDSTLDLVYRMLVDTTTPEGSVRAIVVPDNVPYISRTVQITKDEFVCDRNIRIYAPYQDIWRDVELEIRFALDPVSASRCRGNCPILETFNGRDPTTSTKDVVKKTIQYDKNCGDDNLCDTKLTLKVAPLANDGQYIVAGKDKHLDVKVGLINGGENAYNIILDVSVHGNLSSAIRTHDAGDSIIDCPLVLFGLDSPLDVSTYRCRIRKPYPLKNMEEVTFKLAFPLGNHLTDSEFIANFSLRTEDINKPVATAGLRLPVKSEYGFKIEGISGPEQVTLGVQQAWNTWTEVEHRYSIKNLGPSPLENSEILAFVPAIIHRNEPLVTNISVWVTNYNNVQPAKLACTETSRDVSIPSAESSGGYAISVDCSSFPCRRYRCDIGEFLKDQSVLVSVNMSVSRQILVRLQARDTVRLASRLSIPGVNFGKSLDKEVETMFHKTTNNMERKKLSIPIWLVIVSVVSAFLVLLVIVAILIKVGFFKRSKKEEMRRLMSTRSSPFSKDSSGEPRNKVNGSTDNSRIISSIEDEVEDSSYEHAHINPAIDSDSLYNPSAAANGGTVDIDSGYLQPKSAFLADLENVTKRKGNSREDLNRIDHFDKS